MRGIKPCNDHFVYCILKVVLCILLTNFLYRIQPIVDRGVIQIPHGNDIYYSDAICYLMAARNGWISSLVFIALICQICDVL